MKVPPGTDPLRTRAPKWFSTDWNRIGNGQGCARQQFRHTEPLGRDASFARLAPERGEDHGQQTTPLHDPRRARREPRCRFARTRLEPGPKAPQGHHAVQGHADRPQRGAGRAHEGHGQPHAHVQQRQHDLVHPHLREPERARVAGARPLRAAERERRHLVLLLRRHEAGMPGRQHLDAGHRHRHRRGGRRGRDPDSGPRRRRHRGDRAGDPRGLRLRERPHHAEPGRRDPRPARRDARPRPRPWARQAATTTSSELAIG